jgi:hypothetical protein
MHDNYYHSAYLLVPSGDILRACEGLGNPPGSSDEFRRRMGPLTEWPEVFRLIVRGIDEDFGPLVPYDLKRRG